MEIILFVDFLPREDIIRVRGGAMASYRKAIERATQQHVARTDWIVEF